MSRLSLFYSRSLSSLLSISAILYLSLPLLSLYSLSPLSLSLSSSLSSPSLSLSSLSLHSPLAGIVLPCDILALSIKYAWTPEMKLI